MSVKPARWRFSDCLARRSAARSIIVASPDRASAALFIAGSSTPPKVLQV
jgi:hypothetical protein